VKAIGYQVVTIATGYTSSYSQSGNTDGHWSIMNAAFRPTATDSVASVRRHKKGVF
jgi:hypothetical protein